MDSGGTGVQGLRKLGIGPAAVGGLAIGFEQDPRMEQLRRRGMPRAYEG
jgi:hypothetical protein